MKGCFSWNFKTYYKRRRGKKWRWS